MKVGVEVSDGEGEGVSLPIVDVRVTVSDTVEESVKDMLPVKVADIVTLLLRGYAESVRDWLIVTLSLRLRERAMRLSDAVAEISDESEKEIDVELVRRRLLFVHVAEYGNVELFVSVCDGDRDAECCSCDSVSVIEMVCDSDADVVASAESDSGVLESDAEVDRDSVIVVLRDSVRSRVEVLLDDVDFVCSCDFVLDVVFVVVGDGLVVAETSLVTLCD